MWDIISKKSNAFVNINAYELGASFISSLRLRKLRLWEFRAEETEALLC